ncbi:carbohydrate-binding protein [Nonomuraea ferruginea]
MSTYVPCVTRLPRHDPLRPRHRRRPRRVRRDGRRLRGLDGLDPLHRCGTRVTHNGVDYECLQSHTSQPGWEPNVVPALWKQVGGGSGGDTQAPSVPGNLRSTGVTSSSVSLAWNAATDNVGVTGYDVYRGGSLVTTVGGTSYTDTGRAANTGYTYTVRARDASRATSPATATPSPHAPPPAATTPARTRAGCPAPPTSGWAGATRPTRAPSWTRPASSRSPWRSSCPAAAATRHGTASAPSPAAPTSRRSTRSSPRAAASRSPSAAGRATSSARTAPPRRPSPAPCSRSSTRSARPWSTSTSRTTTSSRTTPCRTAS